MTKIQSDEAQESTEKEATPEWLAAQTFESASDVMPLDGMMGNDEMSARGIDEGIWMRTCAVILRDDDKQLYAKFKDDESAEVFLDMMEKLSGFIDSQEAGVEILKSCRMRLRICLSRYWVANGGA